MRNTVLLIALTYSCFALTVKGQDISDIDLYDIRKDFNKGVKDEKLCKQYLQVLKTNPKTSIERGYLAAFTMFTAKHTINPFKKMSHFKEGRKMLEQQIQQDPQNPELRFIRFCIQHYTPDFLGYKDNLTEDKQFLLANLHKMTDEKAKTIIFNFLKGTKLFSQDELKQLSK